MTYTEPLLLVLLTAALVGRYALEALMAYGPRGHLKTGPGLTKQGVSPDEHSAPSVRMLKIVLNGLMHLDSKLCVPVTQLKMEPVRQHKRKQ